ncbi:MAG: hypothetical protein SGJ20_17915 [Planctomycetota bacterium]|nr:hypothetical protein [Planctomycetota bacterium]
MLAVKETTPRPKPTLPRGAMPPRMRALYVTTANRTGGWLAEAFAADSASEVELEETIGAAAGMARLRDEVYDMVLISHEPGELDALELVQGLRGSGGDEPVLLLGRASEQEMTALAYEVGADGYLSVQTCTTRTLLWTAARAIERHQLLRENRRLLQADRQRLHQEHLEADRLLAEQRALISDLEVLATGAAFHTDSVPEAAVCDAVSATLPSPKTKRGKSKPASENPEPAEQSLPTAKKRTAKRPAANEQPAANNTLTRIPDTAPRTTELVRLPENLVAHYRELLRAYVIMGSGNLTHEMRGLTELFVTIGISPQQTMLLHLQVLEELVRGLGSRSARHVMTRADLLGLELMIHLAEGYRERYVECVNPPKQQWLPGFQSYLTNG